MSSFEKRRSPGTELESVGFWLNAWLARPRHMTTKSDLMYTPIRVSGCLRTDENESHLHDGVRMGTAKR